MDNQRMHKVLYLLLGLSGFFGFLYGILNVLEVETNVCRMTYMYERPQYLRLKISEHPNFTNYGLYYYYEGRPVSSSQRMKFTGAPVVFVPGNGGSYKQVRSLASVALRKSLDGGNRRRLNYFAVSYNEELTGLNGGYLKNQQLFLQHCVRSIYKLYKNATKIILIGHSMGGKVAQSMLMENADFINSMLFIATPLDTPVVIFDPAIHQFYEVTNKFLLEHRVIYKSEESPGANSSPSRILQSSGENNNTVKYNVNNILLISIGGGNRDFMVTDDRTVSRYSDLHAMTSSIPKVWLSCDHLAAVWCLQLVLVINRFLFSILTNESKFLEDKVKRFRIAKNYFVYGSQAIYPDIWDVGIWDEDTRPVYTKSYDARRSSTIYHMIPVKDITERIYSYVTNVNYDSWIFGCVVSKGTATHCENAVDLSNLAIKSPTEKQIRHVITIELNQFKETYDNWTHIVIRILPSSKEVELHIDTSVSDPNARNQLILRESWLSAPIYKRTIIETDRGRAYYKLLFPSLNEPTQALIVFVEPDHLCAVHYFTAKVSIPWSRGFEQYHHQHTKNLSFLFSIPVAAPQGFNITADPAVVELFLDAQCRYTISYKLSIGGTFARIVRHFFQYIPAHVTSLLLLALKKQGTTPTNDIQNLNSKLWSFQCTILQPTATFLLAICSFVFYIGLRVISALPSPNNLSHSAFVFTIIHSAALLITLLITTIVWLCLLLVNGAARILGLWSKLSAICAHLLYTLGHLFPFSLAVVLFSIACYATGELALILLWFIYLIKIAKLYLSNRQKGTVKNIGSTTKNVEQNIELMHINIQISLLSMLIIVILINLPATIAYFKSWPHNPHDPLPDHTLVPSIIIMGCVFLICEWKHKVLRDSNFVGTILFACACICLIYCQESIYRLTYIIAFVFALVLLL